MTECDSWHSISAFSFWDKEESKTLSFHTVIHSQWTKGLRDPSTDRTSNCEWLPMHYDFSSHTQPDQSLL